jgi:hypothetical protein
MTKKIQEWTWRHLQALTQASKPEVTEELQDWACRRLQGLTQAYRPMGIVETCLVMLASA